MTRYDEFVHKASLAYTAAHFEDGSAVTGDLQIYIESLLKHLPAGPCPGLIGGRLRYADMNTGVMKEVRILNATVTTFQNTLNVTLAYPPYIADGQDVAVIWPL